MSIKNTMINRKSSLQTTNESTTRKHTLCLPPSSSPSSFHNMAELFLQSTLGSLLKAARESTSFLEAARELRARLRDILPCLNLLSREYKSVEILY